MCVSCSGRSHPNLHIVSGLFVRAHLERRRRAEAVTNAVAVVRRSLRPWSGSAKGSAAAAAAAAPNFTVNWNFIIKLHGGSFTLKAGDAL